MRLAVLLFFMLHTFVFTAEDFFALLPENTQLVIHADLHRLFNSSLINELTGSSGLPQLQAICNQSKLLAGVDMQRQLDYLIVAAPSDQQSKIIFILKGSFDNRGPETLLKNNSHTTTQNFQNIPVYIIETGSDKLYLVLPRSGMIVGGFDWLYLCSELEVIASKRKNALQSEIASNFQLKYNGGINVAINRSGEFFAKVQTLSSTKTMFFSATPQDKSFNAKLDLNFNSEDSAQQLFEFSKIIARVIIDKYKIPADATSSTMTPVANILQKINFETAGRSMTVSLNCPERDISELIRSCAPFHLPFDNIVSLRTTR